MIQEAKSALKVSAKLIFPHTLASPRVGERCREATERGRS